MNESVFGIAEDVQAHEISCDICMDLMPLVQDGIASEDSRKAVETHLRHCESCQNCFSEAHGEGDHKTDIDSEKLWSKVLRKVRISSAAFLMLGIFFGLSLTASQEMFYNSLLMPLVGAVGYVVFRWHALWVVPVLMLVTNCLGSLLGMLRGVEYLDLLSAVMWVAIYSVFVAIGIVIAGLLHFAFRREKS